MKKFGAVILVLIMVLSLTALPGCWFTAPTVDPNAGLTPAADPDSDTDLYRVNEAWAIITENYVGRDDIDAEVMSRAAIDAMIESIGDPYGAYLDADQRSLSMSSSAGQISGIGATVSNRDGKIIIVTPRPGLPAAKAGILAGDEIIAVDGVPVTEMTYTEVILHVRGEEGTEVVLTVLHEGETEPVEITVVRAEIDIPSVNFEMKTDTIAYIQITSFTQRTADELSEVLDSVRRDGAESIILDLQNNPGGTVTSVVECASQFYRDGIVLIVEDKDGVRQDYHTVDYFRTTDLPMVVLVNEYSASGSEVLSGFLQHYDRAVIAGNVTFGKCSVNRLYPMSDGGGLYVSVSRWLTPGLEYIEGQGITPDIILDVEDHAAAVEWAVDYLPSPQA